MRFLFRIICLLNSFDRVCYLIFIYFVWYLCYITKNIWIVWILYYFIIIFITFHLSYCWIFEFISVLWGYTIFVVVYYFFVKILKPWRNLLLFLIHCLLSCRLIPTINSNTGQPGPLLLLRPHVEKWWRNFIFILAKRPYTVIFRLLLGLRTIWLHNIIFKSFTLWYKDS